MQFTIKKTELLRQLPQGELPNEIILEGLPYNKKDEDTLYKKYEDIANILSRTQWNFFKELVLHPEGATMTMLLKFVNQDASLPDNIVAVHMGNLRKKLAKHKKTYQIKTLRHGAVTETTYKLVRTVDNVLG